jgi:sugar lactone lactonase YvrE
MQSFFTVRRILVVVLLLIALTIPLAAADGYTLVTSWGSTLSGNGEFNHPRDVAVGSGGNVYVADTGNHRIQSFGPDGRFISSWNVDGDQGGFLYPRYISIDSAGTIYVLASPSSSGGGESLITYSSAGQRIGKMVVGSSRFAVDPKGTVYTYSVYSGSDIEVRDPKGNILRRLSLNNWSLRLQAVTTDSRGNTYALSYLDDWQARNQIVPDAAGHYLIPFIITTIGPEGSPVSSQTVYLPMNDPYYIYYNDEIDLIAEPSGSFLVSIATNIGNPEARIIRIDPSGTATTVIGGYRNCGKDGDLSYPAGFATDASGNIYIADSDNQNLQKYSSSGQFITAWGADLRSAGKFHGPTGITVDSQGKVYVADSCNDRIQVHDPEGKLIATWGPPAGTGSGYSPQDISADASDTVYVLDRAGPQQEIIRFDTGGSVLGRWDAGGRDGDGYWYIYTLGVDASGNVFGYNHQKFQIRKYDADGRLLTQWGSQGEGDGQFKSLSALGVDKGGNVYAGDTFYSYTGSTSTGTSRIQKFDPNGRFLLKWGRSGFEPGSYGNEDGQFRYPTAIATDDAGYVYVGDQSERVQKFDSSGAFVALINNYGEIGSVQAIAVDRQGNVYIADSGNSRVVKYTPSGFSAVADDPTLGIKPDGQLPLANAVDAGGVRTYAAIERASGNGDSGNVTVLPRTIPASAVLPTVVIPATAVVAGAAVGGIAAAGSVTTSSATASGTGLLARILSGLRLALGKVVAFVRGVLEEYVLKWLTKIDVIKKCHDAISRFLKSGTITSDAPETAHITRNEIFVMLLSPLLLAGAFVFAERTWNLPAAMGIYVIVAAVAMIGRDLVQKGVARYLAIYSKLRFWSLGTIIMFATGGLFGSVFGSVTRFDLNENLIAGESQHKQKKIALVALAGPVMSVILAAVFLFLFPIGGIFYLIGITGFSMNLMSATYSMMPFIPMEGADVYKWHLKIWLLIFVPLMLAYMIIITPVSLF